MCVCSCFLFFSLFSFFFPPSSPTREQQTNKRLVLFLSLSEVSSYFFVFPTRSTTTTKKKEIYIFPILNIPHDQKVSNKQTKKLSFLSSRLFFFCFLRSHFWDGSLYLRFFFVLRFLFLFSVTLDGDRVTKKKTQTFKKNKTQKTTDPFQTTWQCCWVSLNVPPAPFPWGRRNQWRVIETHKGVASFGLHTLLASYFICSFSSRSINKRSLSLIFFLFFYSLR